MDTKYNQTYMITASIKWAKIYIYEMSGKVTS